MCRRWYHLPRSADGRRRRHRHPRVDRNSQRTRLSHSRTQGRFGIRLILPREEVGRLTLCSTLPNVLPAAVRASRKCNASGPARPWARSVGPEGTVRRNRHAPVSQAPRLGRPHALPSCRLSIRHAGTLSLIPLQYPSVSRIRVTDISRANNRRQKRSASSSGNPYRAPLALRRNSERPRTIATS